MHTCMLGWVVRFLMDCDASTRLRRVVYCAALLAPYGAVLYSLLELFLLPQLQLAPAHLLPPV